MLCRKETAAARFVTGMRRIPDLSDESIETSISGAGDRQKVPGGCETRFDDSGNFRLKS